jgi:hypothetical protein
MISCTIYVRCDGMFDSEDPCEAEFEMSEHIKGAVGTLDVAHQMQQRGWVTKRHADDKRLLSLCPLHKETG